MGKKISIAPGEFYHLYNRGTEKRDIFLDTNDYDRFLSLLYLANSRLAVDIKLQGSTLYEALAVDRGPTLVDICSYVLMPNHFHLLVKEKIDSDGKGIALFMQKLSTGYTMYFNTRNERSGSLFQGRYKASHANTDRYLKYLISYIHLNPVKLIEPNWKETGIEDRVRAEKYLEGYPHSSYRDFLAHVRPEGIILSQNILPEYFETPNDFKSSVTEWLQRDNLQGSTL